MLTMTGVQFFLAISQLQGSSDGVKSISMELEVFANPMNLKPHQVTIEWRLGKFTPLAPPHSKSQFPTTVRISNVHHSQHQ